MNWRTPRSAWGARLVASILMATAVGLGAAPGAFAQGTASSPTLTPPPVPPAIEVPAGNNVFLVGHAVGTQNYGCVPSGSGVKFVLFTPEATLFNTDEAQLTTHYFSPNPYEAGPIRATWEDSRDTSTVWGQVSQSSSDPNFVRSDAIAWVLLQRVGAQDGPDGGDTLSGTSYIQRLNTSGGLAPSTGCDSSSDVGAQAFVPYTADYFFYKHTDD